VAGGDTIADEIARAIDGGIKALVVRVDSPGGSVMASERIRQALIAAKSNGIPVVVSMGNVAASGGYWLAAPADFIYAEPATITGSIGVFGVLPSFQGSLEKLGIGADGVKSTPLSGEPDLLRGPSPEANALIQTSVEATYARFLDIVAKARRKTPQQVDAIAQGRVWDGGAARQLGLIDGFGGMEEAVAKAAALAKLDTKSVRYIEPPKSVEDELVEMLANDRDDDGAAPADAFAQFAEGPRRQLAAVVAELQSLLDGPVIQARCLECGPTSVAISKSERSGFWAALLERLIG
jgi:protease-4